MFGHQQRMWLLWITVQDCQRARCLVESKKLNWTSSSWSSSVSFCTQGQILGTTAFIITRIYPVSFRILIFLSADYSGMYIMRNYQLEFKALIYCIWTTNLKVLIKNATIGKNRLTKHALMETIYSFWLRWIDIVLYWLFYFF